MLVNLLAKSFTVFKIFVCNLGSLKDGHIWMLAEKITNVSDLRTLALRGLDLDSNTVDSTTYNNEKAIQEAAYRILQKWLQKQDNKQNAYTNLLAALRNCGFNMMATELKKEVEK